MEPVDHCEGGSRETRPSLDRRFPGSDRLSLDLFYGIIVLVTVMLLTVGLSFAC
jgi:hypothetical protein